MKPDEAIELLKNMKWSITTKFNAVNNSTKALDMAISALEKQEKDRWIPVIRCEDCKYYGSRRWCELHSSVFDDNAFCSYGEREERSEQDDND